MNRPMELKQPVVLDACEADRATCHPTERALNSYVANEMGARRKKVVVQHLESCEGCRKSVVRLHALARTYRDWERSAIEQAPVA
jgi:predicted anti-sigma-YlaC factor YlaD